MVRGLEEAGGMPDSRGTSPVRGAPVQLPQVNVDSILTGMKNHISGPNKVQLVGFHPSQSPGRQSKVRPNLGNFVILCACSKMNLEAEEAVEAEDDYVTIQVSLKYSIKVSPKYSLKCRIKSP